MSLVHAVVIFAILGAVLTVVPMMIWVERRLSALIQGRLGPNRVGPLGLLQAVADAIKLLAKEETVPDGADRGLFFLAPVLAFIPPALALAAVPFGHGFALGDGTWVPMQVVDLNVGILFVLAIGSLGIYGIAFGGWSSNSKYPLLAGLRSSAQMVSYEIAMGLAVIVVVMTSGSVHFGEIVSAQIHPDKVLFGFLPIGWNVFQQPLACLIFLVAAFAETNRLPFDLPEAESELVAGYHVEYSGMKFSMFFLGEYVAMFTMSAVWVTMFFGGWGCPLLIDPASTGLMSALVSVAVFFTKTMAVMVFYVWVRWTLPRFRYDQLMNLGWKGLIPLGLANILVTGLVGVL